MADMIRRDENLVAVRVARSMQRQDPKRTPDPYVDAELLRGDEKFESLSVPLAALAGDMPDRLWDLFRAGADAAEGTPVWLQLTFGVGSLASFPWEDSVEGIGVPLLRVPNFARNGYRRDPEGAIIICAGSPIAKDSPPMTEELLSLIRDLREASSGKIWIFASPQDYRLRDDLERLAKDPGIVVPAPPDTVQAPARRSGISTRTTVTNPWLTWMIDALGSTKVHVAHFISPGYLSGENGALALPETPIHDRDRGFARFVGAEELATFLDTVQCQIAGFTAVGSAKWRAGIPVLANDLSWLRPGPIVAASRGEAAPGRAYGALIAGFDLGDAPNPGLMFSVHPSALEITSDAMNFRTLTLGDHPIGLESSSPDYTAFVERDVPDEISSALTRLSTARPQSPAQRARTRGALNALELVARLTGGEL
ncbi:hypothetical protein [Allomesorhizobium alhagi]|uniref:Uncharacterized protein n=1 Tax=Mesorhizobium alhagi CCNWXJ12-2 TaxID=1107882 RepID=H0HQ92_9HYPH|nr:hypothetical protein [Mesorhizobium alhagi]EHK57118.1 hypothetical protein MAXJ12_11612 [Mesorhizobium alhagi CCNWXJ12-2]